MDIALDRKKLLDETGWRLLRELQEDARLSYAELGRRVGLSLPAVAERVRKMEEAGIITGYRAEIDPAKIGLPISAFIRLRPGGRLGHQRVRALIVELPEVAACYHVAGSDAFILQLAVPSIEHLEGVIERLGSYGQAATSIVLSTVLKRTAAGQIQKDGPSSVDDDQKSLPLRARISRFRPPGEK